MGRVLAFVVPVVVGLTGAASPAHSYNGNIPFMMWDTQRAMVDGNYSRALKIIGVALLHLKDEGFTRSERALAKLAQRRQTATADDLPQIEAEEALINLRLVWLTMLRDENEWWRTELKSEKNGIIPFVREEIRRKLEAERACLEPEFLALVADLTEGNFDKAHELRGQALALWQREVQSATERRDQALGASAAAKTPEERAEPDAQAAYLDRWINTAAYHVENLAKEYEAELDPNLHVSRAAYYVAHKSLNRTPKCKAFRTLEEAYLAKAQWAAQKQGITLELPQDPKAKLPVHPAQWCCSTVVDAQWFVFPMELPQEAQPK